MNEFQLALAAMILISYISSVYFFIRSGISIWRLDFSSKERRSRTLSNLMRHMFLGFSFSLLGHFGKHLLLESLT